ncbi:polyprenyl synthetase family protein [Chloroflexota bacterium]
MVRWPTIASYRHIIMQQERQTELLREGIDGILASLLEEYSLYELGKESVYKIRRGLGVGAEKNKPWSLLPLIVCESIIGHCEHAVPAAVALHLMNTAAEVFDDIEDADSPLTLLSRYNTPVATNIATTLLILAEKAITQLKAKGVEDNVTIGVMDAINSYYTTACIGQHLDLSLSPVEVVSEKVYSKITSMKSASTIECACHVGAILAGADTSVADLFTRFGNNLGMAAQIANDIDGITRGRDITGRRITLPVIYALGQTDGEARNLLEGIFVKQAESEIDLSQISDLLFSSGAVQYSIVQMELYKQKALDVLSEAERAGVNVKQLKEFLG